MEPIAVVAALLRQQMPDVSFRVGSTLMARVASRGEQHAVIVLAGIPLTAEIPAGVETGATLRLKVHEVTPERVTLQIDQQAQIVNPQAPLPQADRPLVTVEEPPHRGGGADGEPADIVALSFNSPALGRLDLRLELRGERLLADVTTPAGPPLALAQASTERLRANLEAAGLDPTVRVHQRREPLDVYAW
jgi:hypothetical protein